MQRAPAHLPHPIGEEAAGAAAEAIGAVVGATGADSAEVATQAAAVPEETGN